MPLYVHLHTNIKCYRAAITAIIIIITKNVRPDAFGKHTTALSTITLIIFVGQQMYSAVVFTVTGRFNCIGVLSNGLMKTVNIIDML